MTKLTKKLFAALLAIALAFSPLATTVTVRAAREPYVMVFKSNSTMEYFVFKPEGYAEADGTRSVSFPGTTVSLVDNTLTSTRKAGTEPAWTTDVNYLFWTEANGTLGCYDFIKKQLYPINGITNASDLEKNNDGFLLNIKLADGTTITPQEALNKKTNTTTVPSTPSTGTSTGSAIVTNPTTPTTPSTPGNSGVPVGGNGNNSSTSTGKVDFVIDAAGRAKYTYKGHTILIDGTKVFCDNVLISKLSESGARYLGVSDDAVYFYADSLGKYYRFYFANMYILEVLRFSVDCRLIETVTNDNGVMTGIKTTIGTYNLSQLVVEEVWTPSKTYAINDPSGYCSFYLALTEICHELTIKTGTLYFNGTTNITTGLTKTNNVIGAQVEQLVVVKGTQAFRAPWNDPTNLKLWKQNVAELVYSTENGLVPEEGGVRYLDNKVDYSKNNPTFTKALLHQSGKLEHTVKYKKTKKGGMQVLFDGHEIAKLSKKQVKKGKKFTLVGFTEENYVVYRIGNSEVHRLTLENAARTDYVNKAAKWNVSSISADARGFLVGK